MDDLRNIRYTAAVAKCRGTYRHISDIADDVPIRTTVDYWQNAAYAKPYHPRVSLDTKYLESKRSRPRSAPPHLAEGGDNYLGSQYHESCQPRKPASIAEKVPLTTAELRKADVVSQDAIWKQSVGNEQKGLQKWEQAYGYLTEYDGKGNPITKEPLPDSYEQFKPQGPVPLTNSKHYGSRIHTELGQTMLQLEYQLSKQNKKNKLDTEMICY